MILIHKICKTCNKDFYLTPYYAKKRKFCSPKCYWIFSKLHPNKGTFPKGHISKYGFKKGHIGKKGKEHHNWKNGTKKMLEGYILRKCPGHPFAYKYGEYVPEHRLVMEDYLGRYLYPKEQIHHKNGIRNDNRIENLQIVGYPHFGKISCPFCQKTFLIR